MLKYNVKFFINPSQDFLREKALELPTVLKSIYGNLDRITELKARMQKYTYIMDTPNQAEKYSVKVIHPKFAEQLINQQKEYIEKIGELIEIRGKLGAGERAVKVRWLYTPEAANIAAMQQILSFPCEEEPFTPNFTLVMTPGFKPNMPGKMAILVDLKNFITYVMGSDYFGESKKGALRMLNYYVYNKGGLVFHAGAKAIKIENEFYTVAILGLSGTGKTTTTFSKQGELTKPIQDDMIVMWNDGKISVTENGCFAKTFGLNKEKEPIIYNGTIDFNSWLENVYMNEDGTYDFSKEILSPEEVKRYKEIFIKTGFDQKNIEKYINREIELKDILDDYNIPKDGWDFVVWTQNGRSVIPLKAIPNVWNDLSNIPPLKYMGILNRDEEKASAIPAIVKFKNPYQAAAYFMLGETSKTSAVGKERGKTRSPFTNPFFPLSHKFQAERFIELLSKFPNIITFMLNTGYIGGDSLDEKRGKALKVKIKHSSILLEYLFRDRVKWTEDPDFGYLIVDIDSPKNAELLKIVPKELLNPVIFFKKKNRLNEYEDWVLRMKNERREYLEKLGVSKDILKFANLL